MKCVRRLRIRRADILSDQTSARAISADAQAESLNSIMMYRGQPGFDEAVLATSFGVEDPGVRPDAMAQVRNIDDVCVAVRLANEMSWRTACCSGGHAWSQNHIRDGGLLINLSRLNNVNVDAGGRTAIVGPGCLSGDLDKALLADNLFFPIAHAYTVGMGGFLLQGGFGWNSRVNGVACESIIAADVVLADGSLVHASENENLDIFWALRGSGTGFFGIVVRFHLCLHDRPRFTGMKMQVFRIEHLEEVVRWAHEVGPNVSPKVEFQMAFNRKAFGIFSHGIEVLSPVLADSRKEAKELLSFIDQGPLRSKASVTLPLIGAPLSRIMKAAEKIIFVPGTRWHVDNVWLDGPIEPAIPAIKKVAHSQPTPPSHMLWLNWNPVKQAREDMAFSMEKGTYLALYGGLKGKKWKPEDRDWATNGAALLEQFSAGSQLADENLARREAVVMDPAHRRKLETLRAKYDPHKRFFSLGSE